MKKISLVSLLAKLGITNKTVKMPVVPVRDHVAVNPLVVVPIQADMVIDLEKDFPSPMYVMEADESNLNLILSSIREV
jgi:hypothetical protein